MPHSTGWIWPGNKASPSIATSSGRASDADAGRRTLAFYQKKQKHPQPGDPADWSDAWVWRTLSLPSPLRVVPHRSHERSAEEATALLAACKARTDGHAPLCTSEKLPADVTALIATY